MTKVIKCGLRFTFTNIIFFPVVFYVKNNLELIIYQDTNISVNLIKNSSTEHKDLLVFSTII
ncbi:LOW QUALITY PROTEIN: hypothetical protein V1478_002922 [Vespula squamosa]|uniref:Uncharacterized protein n=1 Tax=Vespula squamosa TaxID=30214 RepID=A0ABD2BR75_VESSQ